VPVRAALDHVLKLHSPDALRPFLVNRTEVNACFVRSSKAMRPPTDRRHPTHCRRITFRISNDFDDRRTDA